MPSYHKIPDKIILIIINSWHTQLPSVRFGRCSSRMGDHSGFSAINPCHTYKTCSNHNRSSPPPSLQTKTMAIVTGLNSVKKKVIINSKNVRTFTAWYIVHRQPSAGYHTWHTISDKREKIIIVRSVILSLLSDGK